MSDDTPHIVPVALIRRVDDFIAREHDQARKYDNRTPLDDSGAFDLHRLAASIYSFGYADGELAENERERARVRRQRDAATPPVGGGQQ